MSVPPQRGNGQIGGGAVPGPTPQPMDGLPPEIMQLLMAMAAAMAQRQGGGPPPPGPGPGALQGLFGGTPAPTMAGPEAAPTPTAPTAGLGAMAPPQPGPSLTGGIGVPDVGGNGGFANFNRQRGIG